MIKIVDEIRAHKSALLDNNEIMIEMLTEMVEPDALRNSYTLSLLREQNALLKRLINELKEKLKG